MKEGKIMTNRCKFKEVFGIGVKSKQINICDFAAVDCENNFCSKCPADNFWNKEYHEPIVKKHDGEK